MVPPAACAGALWSTIRPRKTRVPCWLEQHAWPLALYTDKNNLFVRSRPVQWQKQLRDQPARTQFGRALAELDISVDKSDGQSAYLSVVSGPCSSSINELEKKKTPGFPGGSSSFDFLLARCRAKEPRTTFQP